MQLSGIVPCTFYEAITRIRRVQHLQGQVFFFPLPPLSALALYGQSLPGVLHTLSVANTAYSIIRFQSS
eukprot:1905786-Rhodomonas_salina.1